MIMKKVVLMLVIALAGAGLFGQTLETWNESVLRPRKMIWNLNRAPYAWLQFNESAAISVAAEDTWYTVSQGDSLWNNGTTSNMTLTNDSLYVTVDGSYIFDLSLSYAATADDTIHIGVKKNSTVYQGPRAVSIGAEVITNSFSGVLPNLDSGDTLIIQIQNSNNTDNPTVVDGSAVFRLIGYD